MACRRDSSRIMVDALEVTIRPSMDTNAKCPPTGMRISGGIGDSAAYAQAASTLSFPATTLAYGTYVSVWWLFTSIETTPLVQSAILQYQ